MPITSEDLIKLVSENSRGNIGAITVMTRMVTQLGADAWPVLMKAKILGYVGPEMWMLYKDECGKDLDKTINELLTRENGPPTEEERIAALNAMMENVNE